MMRSLLADVPVSIATVCAAATAVSLPVLLAGFAAQDTLVQGLPLGAVT